MRVGIDVRPALVQKTGVGRYLLGLVPALVRQGVEVLAFSASFKDRLDPRAFPGAEVVDRRIPSRLLTWAWSRPGRPRFETLAGPVDLTHSPTPLPLPTRTGARVVTVHDLFFLRDPTAGAGEPARDWVPRLRRALAAADAVLCVSEATARAAREILGAPAETLHVVPHGLEPAWQSPPRPDAAAAAAPPPGRPFVLAVGALEVRKNYPRLLAAFARLRRDGVGATGGRDLRLVIAGPDGPDRGAIDAAARRLGLGAGDLVLAGYQDDDALRALYRQAALLAMPSLDEGFGFPVLEAMAAGCPVVAARAGALLEVAGAAALLADPLDEQDIALAMAALLADPSLRRRLVALGHERARAFTWEEAARKTALAYHQALAVRRARADRAKRR